MLLPRIKTFASNESAEAVPTHVTAEEIPLPTIFPPDAAVATSMSAVSVATEEISTTSDMEFILSQINDYRESQGLPKVVPNSQTCDFARLRAEEVSKNFNHDGFNNRYKTNNLPYKTGQKETENLARNSNYRKVVSAWIASPGHAENLRADTPYVCVQGYGEYYAYEGWRP